MPICNVEIAERGESKFHFTFHKLVNTCHLFLVTQ